MIFNSVINKSYSNIVLTWAKNVIKTQLDKGRKSDCKALHRIVILGRVSIPSISIKDLKQKYVWTLEWLYQAFGEQIKPRCVSRVQSRILPHIAFSEVKCLYCQHSVQFNVQFRSYGSTLMIYRLSTVIRPKVWITEELGFHLTGCSRLGWMIFSFVVIKVHVKRSNVWRTCRVRSSMSGREEIPFMLTQCFTGLTNDKIHPSTNRS